MSSDHLPQNTLAASACFLLILRRFFGHAIAKSLPQWAWDKDPKVSNIDISIGHNIAREVVQKRPAIVVQRGSFTTRRSAFGDVGLPEWPQTSDSTLYSKEVYGTMNLNVYSLKSGEAEAIANLVFEMLITQEQLMEKEFTFKWLGDITVGQVQPSEEDKTIKVVPLSISPVVYDFHWSNTPAGTPLKALITSIVPGDVKHEVYKEYFPTT